MEPSKKEGVGKKKGREGGKKREGREEGGRGGGERKGKRVVVALVSFLLLPASQ